MNLTYILSNTLDFSWDSVAGAAKYELQRSTDGNNFSVVATITSTTYSYNPPTGQSYFQVQAKDASNIILATSNSVSFLMTHGQKPFDVKETVITPVTHSIQKRFDVKEIVITPVTHNLRRVFDSRQTVITPVTHSLKKGFDTRQIVITPVKKYQRLQSDTRQVVLLQQYVNRRSATFDTRQEVITPVAHGLQKHFDTRQNIPTAIRHGTSTFDTKQKVFYPQSKTSSFDTRQNVILPSAVGVEFTFPDYKPQTFKRPAPLNGPTDSYAYNLTNDESRVDCQFLADGDRKNANLMLDVRTKLAGRQVIYRRLVNLSVRG